VDKKMKVGISDIGISLPEHYLDAEKLALANNESPEKYTKGLGVKKLSIVVNEDLIDMAVQSALEVIRRQDLRPKDIKWIYIVTESSGDHAKSMGTLVLDGLKKEGFKLENIVPPSELKFACFTMLHALHILDCHIWKYPDKKGLAIGVDATNYRPRSREEPTGGAGAITLLVEKDPALVSLRFNLEGFYAENSFDFWRPWGCPTPIIDGELSVGEYEWVGEKCYEGFHQAEGKKANLENFDGFVCHTPYPKMPTNFLAHLLIMAHRKSSVLKKIQEETQLPLPPIQNGNFRFEKDIVREYTNFIRAFRETELFQNFYLKLKPSLEGASQTANIFAPSIGLALASALTYGNFLSGMQLFLYGYGSGAGGGIGVGEIKSSKFEFNLPAKLENRKELSIDEYHKLREPVNVEMEEYIFTEFKRFIAFEVDRLADQLLIKFLGGGTPKGVIAQRREVFKKSIILKAFKNGEIKDIKEEYLKSLVLKLLGK